MAQSVLTNALELASLLRPTWAQISDEIPAWHPRCEGEEETEEEEAEETGEEEDAETEEEAGEETDAGSGSGEQDWKRMARKHEREAKKARREAERLNGELKKRTDAEKSEKDKAVDEAARSAREEAQTEFDKERRKDRLEVAATKLAAKGIKIGSGEKAKTVRFADPDDALLHIERDIRNGDLDAEDIYDENGKVKIDQLQEALADLLARKPHLAADSKTVKVEGSGDGGKGGPMDTGSTVESELDKVRRHKPGGDRGTSGARATKVA